MICKIICKRIVTYVYSAYCNMKNTSGILPTWQKRVRTCLKHVCTTYVQCYSTSLSRTWYIHVHTFLKMYRHLHTFHESSAKCADHDKSSVRAAFYSCCALGRDLGSEGLALGSVGRMSFSRANTLHTSRQGSNPGRPHRRRQR